MSNPTNITIACHCGKGILSRLIMWQTRGDYSHTSLVLPDGRQIEAWSDGVKVNAKFDAHSSKVELFTVTATDEQIAQIVAFAQNEIGCKYDWYGDFCFLTRMHPNPSNKRWFCSELVYAALAAGGINLFRATEAAEVSPALLARSPLLNPIPQAT